MILKELTMTNIRSYRQTVIPLTTGISLFEGDIGSGKSTILYAIEFALFGLGDLDGGALLRAGTTEGAVSLKFEVDNKEYAIHRSLKRQKKSIRQQSGYILENGTRYDLSVTDLKKWILKILDFKEKSHPRAGSVIYRYAIFVPQEEMKRILGLKPDERMQTLRKAFRVEDYRVASENSTNVIKKLSGNVKFLKGEISDLPTLKENRDQIKKSENQLKKVIESLNKSKKSFLKKEEELKTSLEELQAIGSQIEKKITLVPQWEKALSDLKEQSTIISKELKDIEQEIINRKEKKEKLELVKSPTKKELTELKKEHSNLLKKYNGLTEKIGQLKGKVADYTQILENGICPTCDRVVEAKEFGNILEAKQENVEHTQKQIDQCHKIIIEAQTSIKELEEYNIVQKDLKDLQKKIEKYKESHKTKIEQKSKAEKTCKDLEAALKEANNFIAKNKSVLDRIKQVQNNLTEVQEKISNTKEELAGHEREFKLAQEQLKEINQKIKVKETKKQEIAKLEDQKIWLEDFFIPTLSIIEQHVMLNLNTEFNRRFQDWFSTLIEDPEIHARVDEQFTPIIEQNNYELSVDYLSGGEKTSVALAYRLALNVLIKQVSKAMKSNLFILDEPTDGFSKDQLFRMREILEELGSEQVILVSHEAELESIADKIYRVDKTSDGSKIEVPSI